MAIELLPVALAFAPNAIEKKPFDKAPEPIATDCIPVALACEPMAIHPPPEAILLLPIAAELIPGISAELAEPARKAPVLVSKNKKLPAKYKRSIY